MPVAIDRAVLLPNEYKKEDSPDDTLDPDQDQDQEDVTEPSTATTDTDSDFRQETQRRREEG